MELIGPYLVGSLLLVIAGVAKAIEPADTARALVPLLRLPIGVLQPLIRVGAAGEAVLGTLALLWPGEVTAGLVGLSYLVFCGVVVYARKVGGPLATCGCFGTPDTPATGLHLVVNLALLVSAVAVATDARRGWLWTQLAGQPAHGVALLLASAVATWLAYLVLVALARLEAVRADVGIEHRKAVS